MFSFLVPHRLRRNVLAPEELARLRRAVLDSPYLAATDLNQGFAGTYGFSVLFRRDKLPRFLGVLPAARPYFEKVADPRSEVFFVNPLVIHEGQGVAPHADKTLLSFVPPEFKTPFPYRVSVLYLAVPEGLQGGELVLHRNALMKARVRPKENLLAEFPGWLDHEVTPFQAGQGGPRVSFVCEQYRVRPELLEQVPDFYMETTRSFQDFLDREL